MIKRKKWTLLMYITVGILLSGCSFVVSPSDLIFPPLPKDSITSSLTEKLNQLLPSHMLITPESVDQKQSIIMKDINNDGRLEAFILYKDSIEKPQVHILVLQEENEEWKEVSNIETEYFTLDFFGLHDLDEDGVLEMLLGVGMADVEKGKHLFIYQWEDMSLNMKTDHTYDVIDIADYDKDEKLDLLLVDGKRYENYTAELFSYHQGHLESRSSVSLDSFAFHENVVSGKLDDGRKALFIDSAVGADSMLTEIVTVDQGELVNVADQTDGYSLKIYPMYSKDTNGDGVIEVGDMYIPEGWKDAAFAEILYIETYSSYTIEGVSKKVEERFTDREQGFYLVIPAKWHGKFTLNKIENGVRVLSVSDQELLFEVKWTEKKELESTATLLKETKDTIFYTDMKEKNTFPFEQFHLIKQDL